MIAVVEGPPGAGKSYYAVRKVAQALLAGKIVATNVELADDLGEQLARRNPWRRISKARTSAKAKEIRSRLWQTDSLDELFRLRLAGRGESRGVMVLDEAHSWMNARSWGKEDREAIVKWFTRHRKLGWDVYLISQDAEMIDKQVRGLAEYVVALRNLRKAKVHGIPVSPVNLFVAVWRWHAIGSTVVKREAYMLGADRRLYDTYQLLFGDDDDADGHIWLPRRTFEELPPPSPAAVSAADPSDADALLPAERATPPLSTVALLPPIDSDSTVGAHGT